MFSRAVTMRCQPSALHFLMHVERPERLDQQVRDDLVEDDVPGFAGPWDLVDVEDLVVGVFVVEVDQSVQQSPPARR